jgi:hypothetical protein
MKVLCDVEPAHTHEFPDDWIFAGPRGTDWRADPRWKPSVYIYLDENLRTVWQTSEPKCLDDAVNKFTAHRAYHPVYLQYAPGRGELELAPFKYDYKTDTVYPLEVA